jgi:hypothetical protein
MTPTTDDKLAELPGLTFYVNERISAIAAERDQLIYERDVWRSKATMYGKEAVEARARAEASEAREKALREALEPFADVGELFELETEGFADTDELPLMTSGEEFRLHSLKFGWFRAARQALSQGETP